MTYSNKRRLIQNAVLLCLIVAMALFLTMRKSGDTKVLSQTLYDKTIGDEVTEIIIHVKDRADILLKNVNEVWHIVQPIEFVADEQKVRQLFTLLSENAEKNYPLAGKNLADFGLDENRLSITFNNATLIFGKYNTVWQKRYVKKGDTLYLIAETVSGTMREGVGAFRPNEPRDNGLGQEESE